MKKILFFGLIIFGFTFNGCKKERSNTPAGAKKVTFKVGFSQSTGEISLNSTSSNLRINAADTSVTNHVNTIVYMVFKSDGSLVHNIIQKSTDANFGQYVDNLIPGSYVIGVSAGTSLGISAGSLSTQTVNIPGSNTDMFFKKISLTVSNDFTQNFALDRIASKLVVKFKDALPDSADYIIMEVSSGGGFFVGNETVGSGGVTVSRNLTAAKPRSNYQLSTLFFYKSPTSIRIRVGRKEIDANHPKLIYADRTISNVAGARNAVTTLSGYLFGGGSGTNGYDGFNLVIDSAWKAPINVNF